MVEIRSPNIAFNTAERILEMRLDRSRERRLQAQNQREQAVEERSAKRFENEQQDRRQKRTDQTAIAEQLDMPVEQVRQSDLVSDLNANARAQSAEKRRQIEFEDEQEAKIATRALRGATLVATVLDRAAKKGIPPQDALRSIPPQVFKAMRLEDDMVQEMIVDAEENPEGFIDTYLAALGGEPQEPQAPRARPQLRTLIDPETGVPTVYSVDPNTGEAIPVGRAAFTPNTEQGIAVDPDTGEIVYDNSKIIRDAAAARAAAEVEAVERAKLDADREAEDAPLSVQQSRDLLNSAYLERVEAEDSLDRIDQILEHIDEHGLLAYGIVARSADIAPGTPAFDAKKMIEVLQSRLTFDKINELKAAAQAVGAVGTGLGQIAVKEFEALGNAIAALNSGLSPEMLKRELASVQDRYNRILTAISERVQALEQDGRLADFDDRERLLSLVLVGMPPPAQTVPNRTGRLRENVEDMGLAKQAITGSSGDPEEDMDALRGEVERRLERYER